MKEAYFFDILNPCVENITVAMTTMEFTKKTGQTFSINRKCHYGTELYTLTGMGTIFLATSSYEQAFDRMYQLVCHSYAPCDIEKIITFTDMHGVPLVNTAK